MFNFTELMVNLSFATLMDSVLLKTLTNIMTIVLKYWVIWFWGNWHLRFIYLGAFLFNSTILRSYRQHLEKCKTKGREEKLIILIRLLKFRFNSAYLIIIFIFFNSRSGWNWDASSRLLDTAIELLSKKWRSKFVIQSKYRNFYSMHRMIHQILI